MGITEKGGTMRLGDKKVIVRKGTKAFELYGKEEIFERHRHRYEVNPKYIDLFISKGMTFSATDVDEIRMEILELGGHPFFMGSQFHAEFKSRPQYPSVLHSALVEASARYKKISEKS